MKIFCIARNYVAHAKEMHNAVPSQPVIFMKPESALVKSGSVIPFPSFTKLLHHELEVVLRIGKEGMNISEDDAMNYVDGYGVGIDFTARDMQEECKKNSWPWEIGKAFDNSAPVSEFIPVKDVSMENGIAFHLKINGKLAQEGNTSQMLFPFRKIISFISKFFRIHPGDIIFTGTPAGVGAVHEGDKLEAFLDGRKMLEVTLDK